MLRKNNIIMVIMDIFMLFLILSNYSLFFNEHASIVYIGVFISGVIIVLFCQFRYINKHDLYIIAYLITILGLFVIFGKNYRDLTFIVISIILILSYLVIVSVSQRYGIKQILNSFVKITYIIAIISLIGFVFGTYLNIFKPFEYIDSSVYNWSPWYGYKNYFYLYYEGQYTNIFGMFILRNMALFSEAPLFSTILSEALFINVFLLDNNKKRNIILTIASFTTLSTASIAITICVFFLDIYRKYLRKKKLIVILPIVAAFAAVIVSIVFYDKLFNTNMSGEIRVDDIMACFKSWEQSPWYGNGFKNIAVLKKFRADWRQVGTAGLSTGIGGVFSDGGLILGSVYTLPLIISVIRLFKVKNEKRNLLYLVILLFLLFFVMIYHYTALGMFWVAMSWYIVVELKNINI